MPARSCRENTRSNVQWQPSAFAVIRPRASAWAATFATISACRCRLRRGRFSSTDAAELCQPPWSAEHGGNETRYAQVDVEALEVETTASTKDLDRADIPRTSVPEIWYQLHGQRDRRPVREHDLQCAPLRAVPDSACSRLRSCCTSPGTGRPSEILPQLLLNPSSSRV